VRTFISALIALIVSVGITAHAQQKIGYVNSTKIFQELPEAQEAQKKIDAMTKPLQDSLGAMQKELQAKYDEYQKKEGMMNEAAKKATQQEILDMERKYNEFRVEKFGNDGDLAKQTDKIITPIKEKIIKAIAAVAKEEKYNFVLDKTEQVLVLLYGDPNHDLTFKVIDKLKRGK
jgi:outer membrane protein